AALLWPRPAGACPWTTFCVNALGCLLIGVLMALISETPTVHRLVRPFLGTGVLGGFTTFSTYAVDVRRLLALGQAPTAAAYLLGTLGAAMVMVWAGAGATRRALALRRAR
ncbi:MAG: fluoride efflux transporter FluC, partial [Frankia sp.]